ncbi:MAG: Ca-activated chloride channel [Acidobacteriota bacterium]|jgi:VWFA-related protein|nr:Ca-activated chloride channel [Acidobacteriota bacterium]
MASRRLFLLLIAFAFILTAAPGLQAQQTRPTPTPTPSPRDDQEPLKVFTEEVRLPIVAFDDYGYFDPTLELNDILVIEDGVQQQVRSIRHLPASVLLVLDVDSQITVGKRPETTRSIALRLLSRLRKNDEVAVLQFGTGVQVLQNWTTETEGIPQILKTKLQSGRRGRLSEAIVASAAMLKDKPAGSRHVVLITDGIETPGGRVAYADAVKQLIAAQATVHVISYTGLVREAIDNRYKKGSVSGGDGRQGNQTPGAMDPTMSDGSINRTPSFKLMTIDTDRAMRRWYKKYAEGTKANEQRLVQLAEETGGQLLLPETADDLLKKADEVAHDIGAQYVVTYTPKRPLASATAGEYRKIEVAPRRTGVRLRTRRGYIVKTEEGKR